MTRRAVVALVAAVTAASIAYGGPAFCAPRDPALVRAVGEARKEVQAGAFAAAERTLATVSSSVLADDREALVVRGLACWGRGLARCARSSAVASDYGLVRVADRLLAGQVQKYPPVPGTEWADKVAVMQRIVRREYTARRRAAASLAADCSETDRLLGRAIADFTAACRTTSVNRAEWCELPAAWRLLARVHQLVIWQERTRWQQSASGFTPQATLEPDPSWPVPSASAFNDLQNDVYSDMRSLLERHRTGTEAVLAARCVADGLLLTALATRAMPDWVRRSADLRVGKRGAGAPPSAAGPPRPADADPSLVPPLLRTDPARAISALYGYCSRRQPLVSDFGARYSAHTYNWVLDPGSAAAGVSALARLTNLHPALLELERARVEIGGTARDRETIGHILSACAYGRLRRPLLTATPAPIRKAFLQAPVALLLKDGPSLSVSYDDLFRFLGEAARSAGSEAAKAELQSIRLRLGLLLTTSDLPWDRWQGYQEAGLAIKETSRLAGVLSESQRAAVGAAEARVRAQAEAEAFPATTFAVVGANALWVRDPYTDGRLPLVEPDLAVLPGGFYAIALPKG